MRLVVRDEAAKGLFARATNHSEEIGPIALRELINAAIAYPHDETPTAIDLLVLGELRVLAGKPAAAEAAIRAAIRTDSTKPFFYKSLGWCLLANGKTEDARKAFEKVLNDRRRKQDGTYDLDTADPAQLTAAYFMDLIPEQQYVEHFDSVKSRACIPWFYIAQAREIKGQNENAIKAYERCVELGTSDNPHLRQVWAEWKLQQLRERSK